MEKQIIKAIKTDCQSEKQETSTLQSELLYVLWIVLLTVVFKIIFWL